jgi:hypothetical protein
MFEVFTAVKIQVEVFWIVTPCGVVTEYQLSEVHATSIFSTSETLVSYHNITQHHKPERLYLNL